MAEFFNNMIGLNTNAKDIIKAESQYEKDDEEFASDYSLDFDSAEGSDSDYFAINGSEEYQFDYTQGDNSNAEVKENPFL